MGREVGKEVRKEVGKEMENEVGKEVEKQEGGPQSGDLLVI